VQAVDSNTFGMDGAHRAVQGSTESHGNLRYLYFDGGNAGRLA